MTGRSRLRAVALALGLVAALLIGSGTGGFSTVSGERGVTVSVVPDEEAYLGLEYDEEVTVDTNGTTEVDLIEVTNRFPVEITVEADGDQVDDGPPYVTVAETENDLSSGENATVEAFVDCDGADGGERVDVAINLEARGAGVEVDLTREVEVGCR